MAKDFGQAMDKGYMIPASLAVGSGDAWDIRCQCDTVQDFKTFFTDKGMDIRFEGLVTYEKTNKKLKVYKGNDVWEDATGGAGGDVDLSNYVTLDKLNTELAKKSDIHSHPYKSDSYVPSWSEVTGKPVIPSKTSDLTNDSSFATETFVTNKIAEAQLDGGEVDLSGYATKDELNTKANISHTHTEYAAKSSEHTHDNKVALDKVTDSKINSWDSKATGNHNHDGKYANTSHRHDASEIDNLPEGSSTTVIDNLTSTSATSALSANQGKVLDNKINILNNESVKAEDYVGGVDVNIEPNVLGRIRDIEFQVKNIVNIDMPKINSQLDANENIYYIEDLINLNSEDISNEFETLINRKDNAVYIIQDKSILNISKPIMITRKNVTIKGGTIKVKPNSGILENCINNAYKEIPYVLNLLGEGCKLESIFINGNIEENYIVKSGEKHYGSFSNTQFGYGGISLNSNGCECFNCEIRGFSWGGLIIRPYNSEGEFINKTVKNCVVRNNKIFNCSRDGISTHNSDSVIIEGNYIENISWHYIHDYVDSVNSKISNNYLTLDTKNLFEVYPNHLNDVKNNIICFVVDHNDYISSKVIGTNFSKNKIIGDFKSGIVVDGFATSYTLTDNFIDLKSQLSSNGVLLSLSLGECLISNNIIQNSFFGIVFSFLSETVKKPSYIYDNYCNLDINKNTFNNIKYDNVRMEVKEKNKEGGLIQYIPPTNVKVFDNYSNEYKELFVKNMYENIGFEIYDTNNTFLNKLTTKHGERHIYVDCVNGDDDTIGLLSKPFKTFEKALESAKNSPNCNNYIKILSNIDNDIVIENLKSNSLSNYVIEGWDKNTNSRVRREIKKLTVVGCGYLNIYNIGFNGNDVDLMVNSSIVKVNGCAFNIGNSYGIRAINNSQCLIYSSALNNKTESCVSIETLSKCYVDTNVSLSNSITYIAVSQGGYCALGQNIENDKIKKVTGGFVSQ